jgi:hypothetical protein
MMIRFECNNPHCVNSVVKFFKDKKSIPTILDCGECSVGKLERVFSAPSSKSTQFIDDGVHSRVVEVMNAVVEKESEKQSK